MQSCQTMFPCQHYAMHEKVALIIPAAGIGSRFKSSGEFKKPFTLLKGKPIILHTLERFAGIDTIVQRVVVVHPDDESSIRQRWGKTFAETGVTDIVPGGKVRQESVACGLAALRSDITIVAVHDAVRPFVSKRAILESIEKAAETGGAVVSSKMIATVKRADADGRIIETVPRRDLWMAQTPQTFRRDIILAAHQAAARDGIDATDESYLVERLGLPVDIVPEEPTNIKITTPGDMKIAEALLEM